MPSTIQQDLVPLIGSWRLISAKVTIIDTNETLDAYGPDPVGYMVFSPSGRVMFLFGRAGRSPSKTDEDRLANFTGMMAYTGLVKLNRAGQFTTLVDMAWEPAFLVPQQRYYRLEGTRLFIWTGVQTHPSIAGGRPITSEVVWEREVATGECEASN